MRKNIKEIEKQNEIFKKKFELIEKHKIEPRPLVYDMLDELWESNDVFKDEQILEVVDKIKFYQKRIKHQNMNIQLNTLKEMESLGFTNEVDFEVGYGSKGEIKGDTEYFITLTFRLKGNKKIIDKFISEGWVIDRRYKNDNGSPSIYYSDMYGKNMFFKVSMIVLKYVVEDIF